MDWVDEWLQRVRHESCGGTYSNAAAPAIPTEDAGFTLSEIFPTRIRRPRKTLIEQVDLGLAKQAIRSHVALIRTIPAELFPRIEGMVLRVFRGQSDRDGLIRWLHKVGGVSGARARLIADDQLAKASEAFLRLKWAKQGVQYVKWIHGSSYEPRVYHRTDWDGKSGADGRPNGLNGFVFRMDHPPVIDLSTGERGYPAQLIGCSCHLEPIRMRLELPVKTRAKR